MPQPLNLTFGIELECIVRYPRATYIPALEDLGHPVSSSDTRYDHIIAKIVRQHIALSLQSSGYAARHPPQEQIQSAWMIDTDSSICSSPLFQLEDAEHGYCDVEIKSPACPFSQQALTETEDVLDNLASISDLEFIFDTSCGLHVHVGNESAGFPLQTLKNVCILTAVFEAQFSSLHPPARVLNNEYIKRQSAVFAGKNPWDIAMEIQRCQKTHELVGLWRKPNGEFDKDLACNLLQLVSERGFRTIEFRQHKATMEMGEVCKWVELTTALVRYAHEVPFEDLMRVVEEIAFDPERNVADLLCSLGLIEMAGHYGGCERYEHPRLEGAWVDKSLLGYLDNERDVKSAEEIL